MKVATFIILLFWGINPLLAQEHNEETLEHEPRNFLGLFIGNTIIVESSFQLPTIGVEYVRELTPTIGIGLTAELEIGSHIIQKDELGVVISEVEREAAGLILPSIFIKVYKSLIFTAGYGVEFETNENLALAKAGLEYKLRMHNPNWLILPSVSWDHTKLFNGVVYGVTFGYGF